MKLGIIGTGLIVQEFLPRLIELEGIEVLAIQGIPETAEETQKLAAENGVPHALTTFEELQATGIDTVYIAVPNFLHYSYSKQALEAGLHVIVEKPATSNARELEELAELAKTQNRFIFEAVTTPYLRGFAKIKEWLSRIGQIRLVQSQYSQYSRRYDAFKSGQVLPAFDPNKAGGALMDLNLYNLHMVLGLFGLPEGQSYRANMERGIDTSGILSLDYPDFQAICLAAKDSQGYAQLTIQGDKGVIRTSHPVNVIGQVSLELYDGTSQVFQEDTIENRLEPEFEYFGKIINTQDKEAYEATLERSLAVSRVQTAARLDAGIIFPMDEVE